MADVAEFFASFMKNDQLGRIANAHLAFAEQELLSGCTRHHACQRLVQLHSTAVDFAKTGVPVDVDEINELTRDLRYPDYMGKPKRISFESASAVGSIWRDAKRLPLAIRGRDRARGMDSALLLEGRRRYRALAQTLVWEYNRRLANIMRAYGAFDEGEVMCGRVAQFFNSSRREKISEVQARAPASSRAPGCARGLSDTPYLCHCQLCALCAEGQVAATPTWQCGRLLATCYEFRPPVVSESRGLRSARGKR